MSIDNLLSQVDKLKEEEKKKISEAHEKELGEIDAGFEAELKKDKERLDEALARERERVLLLRRQNKEFELKMKELDKKEAFSKEMEADLKKAMAELPFAEKKKLFLKNVKEVRHLFASADKIISGAGVAGRADEILKEAGVDATVSTGGGSDFFGFILESEDFNVELSLEKVLEDAGKKKAARIANEVFNV